MLSRLKLIPGGIIPLVRDLTQNTGTEQTNTISVYTLFVTLSILVALFTLSGYAFLISFKRLHRISHSETWWKIAIESLSFVSIALQEGNQKFKEAIENKLILNAIQQRDKAIEFLGTAYNDLVAYSIKGTEGCEEIDEFVKFYLEKFVRDFLDNSKDSYRACTYYLNKSSNKLLFFTGYSPQTVPHSRKTLPAGDSLAGYSIEHPYVSHFCVIPHRRRTSLPFHHRNPPGRYKSVVACAIKNPILKTSDSPQMTLCIDCIYNQANAFCDYEYIAKMIVLLSIIFANAQALMNVHDEEIEGYINSLN